MMDDQIHWFSIINSLMIVLFLSGMVAMIMMRTLHRDISNYNQLETAEEVQDETGWKLVRARACCSCEWSMPHFQLRPALKTEHGGSVSFAPNAAYHMRLSHGI